MTEEQKQSLDAQLWKVANELRGKIPADDFRDYILGFIFYKYLSEKIHLYANQLLKADNLEFTDIDEQSTKGQKFINALKVNCVNEIGYFLNPKDLFSQLAKRGSNKSEDGQSSFILDDLTRILGDIERSTAGTDSEEDFDKLFEDIDLTSTKIGRTANSRNDLVVRVLNHLDKISFNVEVIPNKKAPNKTKVNGNDRFLLGDAYEYLIAKFASGAGKKAGEFYTPSEVSRILAKIVALDLKGNKRRLKNVYDPACGSGSLLLKVVRQVAEPKKIQIYGQEQVRTTYNLARMNMILHDVRFDKFQIKNDDTLEHPRHLDLKFEAIVANPPFSARWSASQIHNNDDRFAPYGRLAPASKADFAFIQHMIHHLDDNGIMAVVVPHGVLFRSAAEGHIRQFLIKERNYLDAVIGLPANIFYGTSIPTCILVFKKCRENPDDIFFIDASKGFEKRKNQNILREEDIDKIIQSYAKRKTEDKFSYVASLKEIAKNDYNLNISRYVDIFEEEEPIDLKAVTKELSLVEKNMNTIDKTIRAFCKELNIEAPV